MRFLDASVLAKAYLEDQGSERVRGGKWASTMNFTLPCGPVE